MPYEQRDNSGSLFVNDKKTTEKHPDFTGSGRFNGVEMRLSGWKKISAAGKKYVSISGTPKDYRTSTSPNDKRPWGQKLDDDISF